MAWLSSVEFEKTEDGNRYVRFYYCVGFYRKRRFIKGRNIMYLLEMDGQKRILTNGGNVCFNCTNLVSCDVKVTKMVDGKEQTCGHIVGEPTQYLVNIGVDISSEENSVLKLVACNDTTIRLV